MPYKSAEDRRARYKIHGKFYMRKYQIKNKDKINDYQREYVKKRRREGFYNYWDKIKNDPEKRMLNKNAVKKYQDENRKVINLKFRNQADKLDDRYIIRQLAKVHHVSRKKVKYMNDLIEAYRYVLLIKRQIKNANKN